MRIICYHDFSTDNLPTCLERIILCCMWWIVRNSSYWRRSRVYGAIARRNAMDSTEDLSVVSPLARKFFNRTNHHNSNMYTFLYSCQLPTNFHNTCTVSALPIYIWCLSVWCRFFLTVYGTQRCASNHPDRLYRKGLGTCDALLCESHT